MKFEISGNKTIIKNWHIFLLLLAGAYINIWIMQQFVLTKAVYYHIYADQLEISRIDEIYTFQKRVNFLTYLIIPIIMLVKITFVTLLTQFPLVMKLIDISFGKLFRIISYATVPAVVSTFIKNVWLLNKPAEQLNSHAMAFVPFSLTYFLDGEHYPVAVYRLLGNINIFETLWCVIVAEGLYLTGKLKRFDAYLLSTCIWIALLMFQWIFVLYFAKINN